MEEAAKDHSLSERWIDILVDIWPEIKDEEVMLTKLPNILYALGSNVVTREYSERLRNLRQQAGQTRELSALLEIGIEMAEKNVERVRIMRKRFLRPAAQHK